MAGGALLQKTPYVRLGSKADFGLTSQSGFVCGVNLKSPIRQEQITFCEMSYEPRG